MRLDGQLLFSCMLGRGRKRVTNNLFEGGGLALSLWVDKRAFLINLEGVDGGLESRFLG